MLICWHNASVLHVPSEYDYLYTASTRGLPLYEDGPVTGSPLAEVLDALQRAYAKAVAGQAHLPVRTYHEAGPLANVVKKKGGGKPDADEGTPGGLLGYQRGDPDEDDDD